jgi:hypothetical protein
MSQRGKLRRAQADLRRRAGFGRRLERLIDEERRHKLGPHRRIVRRHLVEDRLVGGEDVPRPFSR